MNRRILEKIYAGLIGMDAGMRLGAPVENPYWTYERLQEYYGDIRGYLRPYFYHTADDDVNGPIIFLRGLTDNGIDRPLTPQAVGETWLNYTRSGKGMFWWGGEDQSTEHRAYKNLKRGIRAPESGSIAINGKDAAEQIGGQIFIDTWGLVFPGRPHEAAKHARIAASVSHDGSGLDGAAFCAACTAAAFEAGSIDEMIEAGLEEIPEGSDYAGVINAVRKFHAANPGDFRACRDFVDKNFENPLGYHIIPNAGICMTGLLYGEGDIGRSMEIAVMCGFDTDCNASTIGTMLGVFGGLKGIPSRYRKPINDNVIISSVSGYLNNVDLADYAKELFCVASHLKGEKIPEEIKRAKPGEKWLDFFLPGSTHCVELSDWKNHNIRHTAAEGGCLELLTDGKNPKPVDVFLKGTFAYRDLEDDRYDPVFAPLVYPGQTVTCRMKSLPVAPATIVVTPFVTCMEDDRRIEMEPVIIGEDWTEITFAVPCLYGDEVHNYGWKVDIRAEEEWIVDKVLIGDICVTGNMDYTIRWEKQREEFGQITPLSFNDCSGQIAGSRLVLTMEDGPYTIGGQAFTGNYYMKNSYVAGTVNVANGESAMMILRGQGTRRYYALGLCGACKVAILKYRDGERTVLAEAGFAWAEGCDYLLEARARGEKLILAIDGREILEAEDGSFEYGMVGLALDGPGEACIGELDIKGSC